MTTMVALLCEHCTCRVDTSCTNCSAPVCSYHACCHEPIREGLCSLQELPEDTFAAQVHNLREETTKLCLEVKAHCPAWLLRLVQRVQR